MDRRLAIIAGAGDLPLQIAAANASALFVCLKGAQAVAPQGMETIDASYEKLGALFKALLAAGVDDVVFAGKVDRPKLNPLRMDRVTMGLFPRVKEVLGKGDDAVLRLVADVFEEQGFRVLATADVTESLAIEASHIGRAMTAQDARDAERAWTLLDVLSDQDVAQGAVVAGGQVLGIETIQGTDALLGFVAQTPEHLKQEARGVFVKRPKRGQDQRMDMPTIGAATIKAVASAGLGGLVLEEGVIVLDQTLVQELLLQNDLFLTVRAVSS